MLNKGIYINESAYTTGFQSLESAIDNIDVSNQLDGVLTSLELETSNRISVDESLESAIRIKNYVIVDTIEDRNNIPENERLIGQLVYVNEDSTEYRLIGTLSNESWVASSSDESESSARISADNSLESAINNIDITDQLDVVLSSLEIETTSRISGDDSLESEINTINVQIPEFIKGSGVTNKIVIWSDGKEVTYDNNLDWDGSKLTTNVQLSDDINNASSSNEGTLRYRKDVNNSYVDICMQTDTDTYEWVNIVQYNW
ncbi:MAG: hypothetical protein WDA02_09890 [Saccharofermentanales bacterium]